MNGWIGILWAYLATAAFAVMFNVRGRDISVSAAGAALGWAVYLSVGAGSESLAFFTASAVTAVYAEIAGRLLGRPATTYLVCALIPLVPGGGMYYMMSKSMAGDLQGALATGFSTLSAAGAIAAGVAVGSAVARLARRL